MWSDKLAVRYGERAAAVVAAPPVGRTAPSGKNEKRARTGGFVPVRALLRWVLRVWDRGGTMRRKEPDPRFMEQGGVHMETSKLETLQDWIDGSSRIVFFGGAGVSTVNG